MRFKLTLALLFLNLLAFGFIFYLDQQSGEAAADRTVGVIDPTFLEAERIVISGAGLEERRVLERVDEAWFLRAPMEWRVNDFAVSHLLNQLRYQQDPVKFSLREIESSGQTLADYGLEVPLLELRFFKRDEQVRLALGAQTEFGGKIYLLGADAETIFVVGRELIDSLALGIDDLLDARIFTMPPFEVRSLNMRISAIGDLSVRLVRAENSWQFEAPLTAEADSQMVESSLANLAALKAERFFPAAIEAEAGLLNPTLRLTLEGNNRRQTLLIGNAVERETGFKRYYAKLDAHESIFSVLAAPFDVLIDAQESLREREFMQDLDPGQVTALQVDNDGNTLNLQRLENRQWQIITPAQSGVEVRPADRQRVLRTLSGFRALEAQAFVSDAPGESALREFGLADPQWALRFERASGPPVLLNLSGPQALPDSSTVIFAQRSDAPYVYQLPLRVSRLLATNPLEYRDRELWNLPSGARIVGLTLRDTASGAVLLGLSRPAGSSWEEAVAGLGEADRPVALELVQMLRAPRVGAYLSETFTDVFIRDIDSRVPWTIELLLSIELPGSQSEAVVETRRLRLTERLGGSFQAGGDPEQGLVFSLAQPMIDALHPFIFRAMPPEDYVRPAPEPAQPEAEAVDAAALEGTENPEATPSAPVLTPEP